MTIVLYNFLFVYDIVYEFCDFVKIILTIKLKRDKKTQVDTSSRYRTCPLTWVSASILAFSCSSISGSLENCANFCSDSSNFSCMAAIFSSWS